ncbi:MAG: hypothetical protein GEU74_11645 [Nitriliruptorales bacterium]|nr:hypothetical protein [Nitriliruptorales bacterium]
MELTGVPNAVESAKTRRAGMHQLLVELEEAIAAATPGREGAWREQVGASLNRLSGSFAHHVAATEAPDGLFDQVRRRAPRLDGRCRRLARDHRSIAEELAAALAALDGDVEEIRERVLATLARLARHRQLGADLVYEAYDVDLGGSD